MNALRWFDREKIAGFVPWTPIQDSDFPDEKVEVGGFKPFYLLNPPAKELDPLAEKHTDYLLELARLMPRVKIHSAKAESLGGGIFRITVVVLNEGYLPTSCEMGQITGQVYPLYLRLTAPQGTHYITGTPRTELGRLRGGEKSRVDVACSPARRRSEASRSNHPRFGARGRLRQRDAGAESSKSRSFARTADEAALPTSRSSISGVWR